MSLTTAPKTNSAERSRYWCDKELVRRTLEGKRVALVGSGPGVLGNEPGYIDGHDVVVRINNWKCTGSRTGRRTDVFYSFFGLSIRKTAAQAAAAGVTLCMCKCPDAKFMTSPWHEQQGKHRGTDFRYIYDERTRWWFCPTYVPTVGEFMEHFTLLDRHVPTTGFSALLDVLSCNPASVYMTGFDFFTSGVHNVNERWRPGNPADPIGHAPPLEALWVKENGYNRGVELDAQARRALNLAWRNAT